MKRVTKTANSPAKAQKIAKKDDENQQQQLPEIPDEIRCIQTNKDIQKLKTLNLKNGAKYQIQRLLGEGVFGIVFECHDENKEKIAAKVMKKTNEPPDTWKIELHILEKVAKYPHDNIIHFLGVESLQSPPTHCTEHVIVTNALGPSVLDVMSTAAKSLNADDQGCTFPTPDIRSIGRQIVAAMAHLDTVVGVYHLDLKPENIYFVADGTFDIHRLPSRHASIRMRDTRVQLGDFGCSKFHKRAETDVKPTMVQTQNYRAPEVFLGLPYSVKSDVWSFGAMMCEMYTGELLFFGTNVDDDGDGEQLRHSEATQFEMMQRVVGQYCSRAMMRKALSEGSEKLRQQAGILQRGAAKKFEPTQPLHMHIKRFDFPAIALFKMLADVLILDPDYRPTFQELQKHTFFVDD